MALTIPNNFSANTTIASADVDANFNAIATYINAGLATADIQDSAITTAKINDLAVTKAKINSDVADGSTLEKASGGELRIKDLGVTLAKLAAAVSGALNPAGTILAYGGASAPTGYLICDGSAVSRTTYSGLFSAIGAAYGAGNSTTTFNVPDLRGQFLRGVTGASATDPNASTRTAAASGGNTGNNVGSVQTGAIASHTHAPGAGGRFVSNVGAGSGDAQFTVPGDLSITTNSGSNAVTAATGGSETRPVNTYVTFIIKT